MSLSSASATCARSTAWDRWTFMRCAASTWTCEPGEFLSVIGPSGSGKSTLFHIIGGLTPPTSGTVRIADRDLSKMSDAGRTNLRKSTVGFVFQKFNLLPNLTARDNIAMARFIAGRNQNHERGVPGHPETARHCTAARSQARGALRRRAAAHRHRARHRQPAVHPAGGRAHREPGHGELPRRAGGPARPQRAGSVRPSS